MIFFLSLLMQALSIHAQFTTPESYDRSLIRACKINDTNKVINLINCGYSTEWRDNENMTALLWTIKLGNYPLSKTLLEQGSRTPEALHLAAKYGHNEIIELLLSYGHPIESNDKDDRTPLLCAVGYRHIHTIKFLIAKGADISNIHKKYGSIFHQTACLDYPREHLQQIVIAHFFANVLSGEKKGQPTLMYLALQCLFKNPGRYKTAKMQLAKDIQEKFDYFMHNHIEQHKKMMDTLFNKQNTFKRIAKQHASEASANMYDTKCYDECYGHLIAQEINKRFGQIIIAP